jgi:hypothetical protein
MFSEVRYGQCIVLQKVDLSRSRQWLGACARILEVMAAAERRMRFTISSRGLSIYLCLYPC